MKAIVLSVGTGNEKQKRKRVMTKFYWIGFEDGLSSSVYNNNGMTSQEAFAYGKGFKAGVRATEEMIAR